MRKRGYTLIELMIAAAVIAILAALVSMSLARHRANSKLGRVSGELAILATATTQYAEDNNYTYPGDVSRGLPAGLDKYLPGQEWPTGAWERGQYDYDAWPHSGQQVYQISYHLCSSGDSAEQCRDNILFPDFTVNSSVFYCISGPCIPHEGMPNIPGYCVNCDPKRVQYDATKPATYEAESVNVN